MKKDWKAHKQQVDMGYIRKRNGYVLSELATVADVLYHYRYEQEMLDQSHKEALEKARSILGKMMRYIGGLNETAEEYSDEWYVLQKVVKHYSRDYEGRKFSEVGDDNRSCNLHYTKAEMREAITEAMDVFGEADYPDEEDWNEERDKLFKKFNCEEEKK